jgi:hypothetical protein
MVSLSTLKNLLVKKEISNLSMCPVCYGPVDDDAIDRMIGDIGVTGTNK